jgi:hypothetical protein
MASLTEARETIDDVKQCAGQAFLYDHMEARAIELSIHLEELWHKWDNKGEKLIHPLNAALDKPKDSLSIDDTYSLINARRDFMVLYAHHLSTMRAVFPDFTSRVMSSGYPSDDEYVQVKASLKEHSEKLGQISLERWKKY